MIALIARPSMLGEINPWKHSPSSQAYPTAAGEAVGGGRCGPFFSAVPCVESGSDCGSGWDGLRGPPPDETERLVCALVAGKHHLAVHGIRALSPVARAVLVKQLR